MTIIIVVSGYCFFSFFVRAFCVRLLNSIRNSYQYVKGSSERNLPFDRAPITYAYS